LQNIQIKYSTTDFKQIQLLIENYKKSFQSSDVSLIVFVSNSDKCSEVYKSLSPRYVTCKYNLTKTENEIDDDVCLININSMNNTKNYALCDKRYNNEQEFFDVFSEYIYEQTSDIENNPV
jgi:hypothetical protein